MSSKFFALVTTENPDVMLEVGLVYPLNAAKNKWMDEVRIVFFGPSEKVVAESAAVQAKVKELLDAGVEVMACKWCSDKNGVSEKLEAVGIKVVYVGTVISNMLKEGWMSLTF